GVGVAARAASQKADDAGVGGVVKRDLARDMHVLVVALAFDAVALSSIAAVGRSHRALCARCLRPGAALAVVGIGFGGLDRVLRLAIPLGGRLQVLPNQVLAIALGSIFRREPERRREERQTSQERD